MESPRSAEPNPDARPGPAEATGRMFSGDLDLPALVAFVNAQHGTTFRISERYLNGEQGAMALTNAESVRFVLKWSPGAEAPGRLPEVTRIVGRLRSRWYPVPRDVARGEFADGWYVIRAALPGAPLRRLTPALLGQIFGLNDRQRDLVPPADPSWPALVVGNVLQGGAGYCLLDPMREHAPETARLLGLVQELVARHRDIVTPTGDVVHFDFQPTNILALPEKISGVVDWDGACSGDRAFDLVTLLFYTYEQEAPREALWRRVTSITEPAAVAVYLGHLIHRQVDWSIRHHAPETVDRWLERARAVLHDLPARTGCDVPPWP